MTVSEYIKQLLSNEEYSFSLQEVEKHSSKDLVAIRREISRLMAKREVVNLRKGFYLIIPPRYSKYAKLPLPLYAEKLFNYLNRKYYTALFSAARIHGASHQQIQRDYFITQTPKLNSIKKGSYDIEFHTTSHWPNGNILIKRSDAGIYKIASPALTFADLVHYHGKIGGLNKVLTPLEEITEELTVDDVESLLRWCNSKSSLQRVGFLLEEILGPNSYSDLILERLQLDSFYPVLLSPRKNEKPGSVNNRWKVDVNMKLETDL